VSDTGSESSLPCHKRLHTEQLLSFRRNAEPAQPGERGKVSIAPTGSAFGGEITLSIKSYIPDRSDSSLLCDETEDEVGAATRTRRSKIQVDWIPERTWLKTEISDAAVETARDSIPDIVSFTILLTTSSLSLLSGSPEPGPGSSNRRHYEAACRASDGRPAFDHRGDDYPPGSLGCGGR
jgi:hypothetical protein